MSTCISMTADYQRNNSRKTTGIPLKGEKNLKSMDDMVASVRLKAMLLLAEYQSQSRSGNPFLDMAIGYVLFAQREKHLFRFLFFDAPKPLTEREQKTINKRIESELGRRLPFESYFGAIDQSSLDAVALRSWFFTHGLAVALMSGAVEVMDEKRLAELLTEAGGAFYYWETRKKAPVSP